MTSFLDQFYGWQNTYIAQFGPKTAVFVQRGTFYEHYEFRPENGPQVGNAREVAEIVNMKLTSCDTELPHSRTNPNMVGIPIISFEHNRDRLMNHGYTIVRVDQEKNGKLITRKVVEISRPSVSCLSADRSGNASTKQNIVSVYLEPVKVKRAIERTTILIGVAATDVLSGSTLISEFYSKETDEIYGLQELYRLLASLDPVEVFIHFHNLPANIADSYISYVKETLNLSKYEYLTIRKNDLSPDLFRIDYQELFIQRVYSSTIEKMNLDRFNYGRIALCLLLQYFHTIDHNILGCLLPPDTNYISEEKQLILTHNAIYQINLVAVSGQRADNGIDSVFSIVNNAKTKMGERRVKERLLHPITSTSELNFSYSLIGYLLNNDALLVALGAQLAKFADIEKFHAQLRTKRISPKDMSTLMDNYLLFIELVNLLVPHGALFSSLFPKPEESLIFNHLLNLLFSNFDSEKLYKAKIRSSVGGRSPQLEFSTPFMKLGVDANFDQVYSEYKRAIVSLDAICTHFNTITQSGAYLWRLDHEAKTARDDSEFENTVVVIYISCSKRQADQLLKNAHLNVPDLKCVTRRQEYNLISPLLESHFETIAKYHRALENLCMERFNLVLNQLERVNLTFLNEFVTSVDFWYSCALTARKNRYHPPSILPISSGGSPSALQSYASFKNLRHPISEKLTPVEYVSNDISFREDRAHIIFGVNSSGKSCLIKSVAISLILAQAGMYVPCEMTFYPYNSVITRLTGDDDIFHNKSSFIVETLELRTVIKGATANTLVVADELCKGTTVADALSLTVATVEQLQKVGASFIFSSHIHELPEYLKSVKIQHLSTEFDNITETLTYNRKLKEGPGESHYGIDVCAAQNFPKDFIIRSREVLKTIQDKEELISTAKSRYNSKVYLVSCKFCGSEEALHTHHIREQHTADKNGFIGDHHKNDSQNQVTLCERCHTSLHAQGKKIEIKETSNGNKIEVRS